MLRIASYIYEKNELYNGLLQGLRYISHLNMLTSYQNNIRHGPSVIYGANNSPSILCAEYWQKGLRCNLSFECYPSGRIWRVEMWIDNIKRNGFVFSWYPSGHLEGICYIHHDLKYQHIDFSYYNNTPHIALWQYES